VSGSARKPAVSVVVALLASGLGVRVGSEMPKEPYPDTFVRVRRLGGTKRNVITDYPMFTIEWWGLSEVAAEALAGRGTDLLEDAPGAYVEYVTEDSSLSEAWVSSFTEIGGPVSNRDPDVRSHARYTSTVELGISTSA